MESLPASVDVETHCVYCPLIFTMIYILRWIISVFGISAWVIKGQEHPALIFIPSSLDSLNPLMNLLGVEGKNPQILLDYLFLQLFHKVNLSPSPIKDRAFGNDDAQLCTFCQPSPPGLIALLTGIREASSSVWTHECSDQRGNHSFSIVWQLSDVSRLCIFKHITTPFMNPGLKTLVPGTAPHTFRQQLPQLDINCDTLSLTLSSLSVSSQKGTLYSLPGCLPLSLESSYSLIIILNTEQQWWSTSFNLQALYSVQVLQPTVVHSVTFHVPPLKAFSHPAEAPVVSDFTLPPVPQANKQQAAQVHSKWTTCSVQAATSPLPPKN